MPFITDEIERVAEALWQADSIRAFGKPRMESWSDCSENEKDKHRFNATHLLKIMLDDECSPLGEDIRFTACDLFTAYLKAQGWIVEGHENDVLCASAAFEMTQRRRGIESARRAMTKACDKAR